MPSEDGGVPVPVLDVPLSGLVEQPVCRSAEGQRARGYDCMDTFQLRTLFTLVPSVAPVKPPDLIIVARAWTMPAARTRADGPVLRDAVEEVADPVPDPACTFTRSYYFDGASGLYIADEPLPHCRDFLEP